MQQKTFTVSAIEPGDTSGCLPEFGRAPDVQRVFGVKRGVLYRKIADGTIKSISLREPGKQFGCRLIHLQSVRDWLNSLLKEQNKESAK